MASGLFNLKQVNQAISQGAWSGYIAPRWVEYLVVAGGGGAGRTANGAGGGGGGGVLSGIVTVAASTSYTVTVGSGGAGSSSTGAAGSSGVASVLGSISAVGGGGGASGSTASTFTNATSGGSGGGGTGGSSGVGSSGAQGTANQGNAGGNGSGNYGGGGGGAGTVGLNGITSSVAGNGGAGIASAISGAVVAYGGGGAGGINATGSGVGGVGGGGSTGLTADSTGVSGGGNTGGGGGGGWGSGANQNGGAGGSGIVVVRYPGSVQFFTGGTLSYANGYIIHTFFANGTLAPTAPTPYVTDYQISRSLRFNSADTTYLSRTPASATNRTTWTYSVWLKISSLVNEAHIFDAGTDQFDFYQPNGELVLYGNATEILKTSQYFRDFSAWYHIVLAWDTTQATSSNRVKLYVNGSQVTAFSAANYPAQNATLAFNNNVQHRIGEYGGGGPFYFNGYMTEINFIDGQALTPSSFGYTNPATGVWSPLKFVGTYGTNGFYLNFSDNSNTTAATLGKDYSGNGNNWTPNNFSVTAGAGNDSLVDSPTSYGTDTGVGGEVRGNYATLNPLKKKSVATISNGNLNLNATSAVYVTGLSTISPSSGNYYMEMLCTGTNTNRPWGIGVVQSNASSDASINDSNTYFVTNNSGSTVNYFLGATQTALSTSSTWVVNDIISLAWNVDSGKFWVGLNGVWYPSSTGGTVASNADVAAGNFPTFSISYSANTNPQVIPAFATYDTTAPVDVNFGQRPFAYTAPSGFKALCTQNLPTPTIGATTATTADKFFTPVLYTGTGASRSVTGLGFAPDLVWIKSRSTADNNWLFDKLRGVTNAIFSNTTAAENNYNGSLTAFNSDGFSTGVEGGVNGSGQSMVAWNWKANGSGSTNTAGSITSTVSANTTSGFSIVTYNGTGANATVGHGLGVAPSMIIIKSRSSAGTNWNSYHVSLGNSACIVLNLTIAAASGTSFFNATTPTSTVFSLGTDGSTNPSGAQQVAYCFAEVAGYSKFGSYTSNNSSDGPFVYCGFRPAYVMIKCTNDGSGTSNWIIKDKLRAANYNPQDGNLYANLSSAEDTTSTVYIDFLSNGFKIRGNYAGINGSGNTLIFAAFAETPTKFSLAR